MWTWEQLRHRAEFEVQQVLRQAELSADDLGYTDFA
jgi:hypothetical protein